MKEQEEWQNNESAANNQGSFSQKPRRPRFTSERSFGTRTERIEPRSRSSFGREEGYQPRSSYQSSYQPRSRSYSEENQGFGSRSSYQPRQSSYQTRAPRQYGNDNQGSYQQRNNSYQTRAPRQYGNDNQGGYQERGNGYQPRQNGYQGRSNGYQQRNNGGYNQRSSNNGFSQRAYNGYAPKKRIEYKSYNPDPNAPLRLNKFLANAGVCSRREADQYITAGVVRVNGEIVTELGTKVSRTDSVHFHDQLVSLEKKVYLVLNKPKDYITTMEDMRERKTVMDLVRNACSERIYPVGRLDRNTTGVLIFTNDGELSTMLTHPKFLKHKIYHVHLDKNASSADLQKIADGITLEDGIIRADAISFASPTDRKQIGIEIHSGRNRIVRRIFESLGYRVLKLDRTVFAGVNKKGLKRGDWRFLTEREVSMLYSVGNGR